LNSKLNIVVRVDLDRARAQVIAKGHVTVHSVNAIYVVAKRANALKQNLQLELDVSHASVDREALEMLQASSQQHHLPVRVDPQQSDCTISVLAPMHQYHPGALAA
jgi:outer membrane protein W